MEENNNSTSIEHNPFTALAEADEQQASIIPSLQTQITNDEDTTNFKYKEQILSKKVIKPYKAKGIFYVNYDEAIGTSANTLVIPVPENIILDVARMQREIAEANSIRLKGNRGIDTSKLQIKLTLVKSRPKKAYVYHKICRAEDCKKEFDTYQQATRYCPECVAKQQLAKQNKVTTLTKKCKKCQIEFTVPVKLRMTKYCNDCTIQK